METKKDTGLIISVIIIFVIVGGLVYIGLSSGSTPSADKDVSENTPTTQTSTNSNSTEQQTVSSTTPSNMNTPLSAIEVGQKFLAENKTKEGVVTLPSGLQYKILTAGSGPKPSKNQIVKVNYEGSLISGKVFDSSYQRGEPIEFPVTGVISGWVEALQLMPVGSTWMLYIPSNLAYGERGASGAIGPNETLIFKVELIAAHN